MILALAAAFQLAIVAPEAAGPPSALVVKDATHSVTLAVVQTPAGPMVRADRLKPILGVTASHLMGDRWVLIVGSSVIELEQGVRVAKVGDASYQLAASPELRKGVLYVPVQLVAELVPRIVPNLIWDPDRFELRAFSTITRVGADDPPARRHERVASSGRSGPPPDESRPSQPVARGVAVARSTAPTGPLRSRHLVVVDAGHGGPDGGMHGPVGSASPIAEKNITLDVAKRVGAALGQRGIDVKYTRTTDTLIALSDRGRIANDAHADLFVSIHVNAANPGWKDPAAARGFETYFLAEAKTEDARRVERMENEVVKFENAGSAHSGDPLSFILNDMAQNEHLREANELAELIQRRVGRVHPGPTRGVKQAGFRVLVTAFMPAVLVEIGFGTNPADAAYMTDPKRMDELSAQISDAIVEYLKRYERRVTASADRPATGVGPAGQ